MSGLEILSAGGLVLFFDFVIAVYIGWRIFKGD